MTLPVTGQYYYFLFFQFSHLFCFLYNIVLFFVLINFFTPTPSPPLTPLPYLSFSLFLSISLIFLHTSFFVFLVSIALSLFLSNIRTFFLYLSLSSILSLVCIQCTYLSQFFSLSRSVKSLFLSPPLLYTSSLFSFAVKDLFSVSHYFYKSKRKLTACRITFMLESFNIFQSSTHLRQTRGSW